MNDLPNGCHQDRRDRLRSVLRRTADADVLLVTHLPNVRYLTGFTGSNAVLVVGLDPDRDLLATDGRYVDQAAEQSPDLPRLIDRDTLAAVLAATAARSVAVEASLTVSDLALVRAAAGEPAVVGPLVEGLRMLKDAAEIDLLARACAITVSALAALEAEMTVGSTELSLARRLEQLFGDLGAEDRAFETIVGSGPNSAIPHHEPGPRRLAAGDLVVVDCGARVGGYHADMTRTFIVGGEPDDWQCEVHEAVLAAQAGATVAYRDGADRRAIDALARDLVERAGLAERFTHGLGHGVGLEIHEAPILGVRSTGTICSGMAITVEPGVYLPGRGGVRIEDTLVVTDAGPRILTEAPRALRAVG